MADVREKIICIKFSFKLTKSVTEILRTLQDAFDEQDRNTQKIKIIYE